MNNKFIFLRHALTKIDPKKPAYKWILRDEGIEQVSQLCDNKIFLDVDVILSSTEKKAIQTAHYIAKSIEKRLLQILL
jgi:broad specificity phosphatase PhoE